jgi:hypothetical protein
MDIAPASEPVRPDARRTHPESRGTVVDLPGAYRISLFSKDSDGQFQSRPSFAAVRSLWPLNKTAEECVRLFTLTRLGYAIRAIVRNRVS